MEGRDDEKSDVYLLVGKQVSAVAGRLATPGSPQCFHLLPPIQAPQDRRLPHKGPGTDRKNTIDYSSAQCIPHFSTFLEPLGHH